MGARNPELSHMADVVAKSWTEGQSAKAISASTGYPLMTVRKIIGVQFGNSEERASRAAAARGSQQLRDEILKYFQSREHI